MLRGRALIALGALIIVSPFLGLPYSWLMFMLPVLGVLVLLVGIRFRRREAPRYDAPRVP
jgi:hypothetical protein